MTKTLPKPTIVFGEVYPALYGAQQSLLQLYTEWHRQERYRLHFVYTAPGPLARAIRELGIPTTQLPVGRLLGSYNRRLLNLRWRDYPALARELFVFSGAVKRLLREQQADLMHCNNDRIGLMSFLGARWARCPLVTHLRRDTTFGLLDRLIYHGSHEMVWVSNRIRVDFGRNNRIASPKGPVIYNGRVLPDADGPSTRSELLAEFSLPPDSLIAVVLASLAPRKGHEMLVEAARIACRKEPRLRFLLAGRDSTPNAAWGRSIEQRVSDANLAERVLFLGHRDDASRLLRGADVLVNPSHREALGGALIEAIGHGVPCVATDAGGTAEIVPDGRCGYLVPRGDHQRLAVKLVELLGDPERRRDFARAGRAHFDERFTLSRCATATGAFFDELIETRRSGRSPRT